MEKDFSQYILVIQINILPLHYKGSFQGAEIPVLHTFCTS